MEYVKSVRSALRPRTLFASACPVLITVSLLYKSHNVSFLQLDALAALGCAVLTQLLGNLSAVYSQLPAHTAAQTAGNRRRQDHPQVIFISPQIIPYLLSLTQVRRWSFLLYGIQLTFLAATHVICDKSVEVTGGMALLATFALIYCRRGEEPLPMVGLREVVVAWAVGPVAMLSTSVYLIGEVPWAVVLYAYLVMLFAWAFLILESARDVPFARRMGRSDTSLALRLGFQWSFQGFLLLMVSFYGMLLVLGIAMGHLGNFLLVVTIAKLKDISEDFRVEKLNHLPDKFARLASFLGVGLIISILAGLS
ncbi:hypothetical protein PR001_g4305 [Phytophthora rubi]|uniref:UbiA prenyltransferase family n=2 Tax=Phytophthora rubi TaxID=129364 RepID=A0A6A3P204_9STRA|nr:hypothetical protein PR001_g4305 [Phytophthora rubi]